MKFAIADVLFWEGLGYDTTHWRKSADGNQAIIDLAYAEILGQNLNQNPAVTIYNADSAILEEILLSQAWANAALNGTYDSYGVLDQVAQFETNINHSIAEFLAGILEEHSGLYVEELTQAEYDAKVVAGTINTYTFYEITDQEDAVYDDLGALLTSVTTATNDMVTLYDTINGKLQTDELVGIMGPAGPQGIQGEVGPQGIQGETGPQGIQGETGPAGAQGIQGETGLQGLQGLQGETGPQGIQGIQGIQGDVGPTGPQGIQGETGLQGIQGIQGEIGPNGSQGLQGEPGTSGTDGLSAYQVAVNNGYIGTEAEWVASVSSVPAELTGNAGKVLTVNDTEDGVIYAETFFTDGGSVVEDFESTTPVLPRVGANYTRIAGGANGSNFCLASEYAYSDQIVSFNIDVAGDGQLKFWYKCRLEGPSFAHPYVKLDGITIMSDIQNTVWAEFTSTITQGAHVLEFCSGTFGGSWLSQIYIDDLTIPAPRLYKHAIGEHEGVPSLLGGAGKALTVNETEDGLAFVDMPVAAAVTKAEVEAVLTGEISSHTHAASGSSTRAICFYVDSTLKVESNVMTFIIPMALTVTDIRLAVDVAPVGAALISDIHKNGTTIYTTQANRPTIAAGALSATATLPDIVSLTLGDKLTLDIDQVGSTTPGENLAVLLVCVEA